MVLSLGDFTSRGHWQCLERFYIVMTWEAVGNATDIEWVEARNPAKHLQFTGQRLHPHPNKEGII